MSLHSKPGSRRRLLALAAFTAVSALSAAPALADHGHTVGGFWFPPVPRIFVPFPPPLVVVAQPYGHHCDYDDHYYDDDGRYGYGRGYYREEWRQHGHDRHYGHGYRGRGRYRH
jgi:hypothetical protein